MPTSSSSWCEWYFDRVIVVRCTTGNSAVLNINPPIMPPAHVGVPYSATFTVSGGTPPYSIGTFTNSPYNLTWSTPTPNSVTLYGTPNATTGSYGDDSVSAQDATGCQTSHVWREIVCDPTQISLTPTTFVWYVGSDNWNMTTPTLSGFADKLDVVISGNVPEQFTWRLLGNMLQFLGSPNQLGAYTFDVTVTHVSNLTHFCPSYTHTHTLRTAQGRLHLHHGWLHRERHLHHSGRLCPLRGQSG